ncbi:MAG: glycoside hydrolase family 16 protein, partial [Luteolibacter sp.]
MIARVTQLFLFSLAFLAPFCVVNAALASDWKLIWQDEFNGQKIDSDRWSPCERGSSDWNNTMTRDPRCFSIGGGTLKLIGIRNPDLEKDPSPFLTGGITSRGKFEIQHGKVEIRARFKSAQGAWPALWMLGAHGGWPNNGEIDIMEHLNFDSHVHQTVHSGFTQSANASKGPKKTITAPIERDDWNVYGVEWNKEKITFSVNGKATHSYPKKPELGPEQWPFDGPFYLIFSMQIGGNWVGKTNP